MRDLKVSEAKVYPYQVTAWQKSGYIIKLKNGLYLIDERKDLVDEKHIAFSLYQPSYISLEWALQGYGIIPEMVYGMTSVTSKTTRTFRNDMGTFIYKHVRPELFFGYRKIDDGKGVYLLAEAEKALLDYLYLNLSKIQDQDDIEELRFNEQILKETIDKKKLIQYSAYFGSKKLNRVIKMVMR